VALDRRRNRDPRDRTQLPAPGLDLWITGAIGAGWTSSTLFFFGIFFVLALSLQFSVKISALETRVKNLAQQLAIVEARKREEAGDA